MATWSDIENCKDCPISDFCEGFKKPLCQLIERTDELAEESSWE